MGIAGRVAPASCIGPFAGSFKGSLQRLFKGSDAAHLHWTYDHAAAPIRAQGHSRGRTQGATRPDPTQGQTSRCVAGSNAMPFANLCLLCFQYEVRRHANGPMLGQSQAYSRGATHPMLKNAEMQTAPRLTHAKWFAGPFAGWFASTNMEQGSFAGRVAPRESLFSLFANRLASSPATGLS